MSDGTPLTLWGSFMIGFAYTLIGMIPWTLVFFVTRRYGIRYYVLNDADTNMRISKRLKDNTSETGNEGRGSGYALGYWYLAHLDGRYADDLKVWMIATEASYKALTKDMDDDDNLPTVTASGEVIPTPTKAIDIYGRCGAYSNIWYRKRPIKNFDFKPRTDQAILIKQIQDLYTKKKAITIFLHGPPCSGKSILGLLLADVYSSSYCNSFSPWEPGDTMACIMDEAEPTKDKPLIIVWEEIDGPLTLIHKGLEPHKNIPILVRNKTGWNNLLDKIQLGLYPNIILLLTSNIPIRKINETLDESYLRQGRMDIIASLGIKED